MAIYHFSVQVINRAGGKSAGHGRSSVACAAYRAGELLVDERNVTLDGRPRIFDYSRRAGVAFSEIMAPVESSPWVYTRNALWNAVEHAEKRGDSQLCREINIALPAELTLEQNVALLRDFVRSQFVAEGMVADVAIHLPHPGGDDRNVHAHVMLTMRDLLRDGFGKKNRSWNDLSLVDRWRQAWTLHANEMLQQFKLDARIDHRSYVAQGSDREPTIHEGPDVSAMERKSRVGGPKTRIRRENEYRRQRNHERDLNRNIRSDRRQRVRAEPDIIITSSDTNRAWREQLLSAKYAVDMRDADLARYWLIDWHGGELRLRNRVGEIHDCGERIAIVQSSAAAIEAALDIAVLKGWSTLAVRGTGDVRAVVRAAAERGFTIRLQSEAELEECLEECRRRRHVHEPRGRVIEAGKIAGLRIGGTVAGESEDGRTVYVNVGRRDVVSINRQSLFGQRVEAGQHVIVDCRDGVRVTTRSGDRDKSDSLELDDLELD